MKSTLTSLILGLFILCSCKESAPQPFNPGGIQHIEPGYVEMNEMRFKPGDSLHLVFLWQSESIIESIDLSIYTQGFNEEDPSILHYFESRYPNTKNAVVEIDLLLPEDHEIPPGITGLSLQVRVRSGGTGSDSISIRLDRD